jgi:cell division protein FtsW
MATTRRTDRSPVANWLWTIDPFLTGAVIFLMIAGLVLSFAGSPPVAERIRAGMHTLADGSRVADSYFFIKRHAMYFALSLPILIGVSFLTPRQVRRVMMLLFGVGLVMLVAVLFFGQEAKGARRWIFVAGMSLQPSEFVKPAFIIVASWLFAEQVRNPRIPGNILSFLLLCVVVALLVLEPDFGQTILTVAAWSAVFFVAGMPILWIMGLGGMGVAGMYGAYLTFPHFASRINRFLDKLNGDEGPKVGGANANFQVDMAEHSFLSGGWFGRGPGEGVVKKMLPDSHTDFIFAVLGEEFGVIMCILLVSVVAFVVLRGLWHAGRNDDPFTRFSITGLVALFGTQSAINMAVNLHLAPAKGMTLPFISYGGTSLMSLAFAMGCLLALCRRKPQASYTSATQWAAHGPQAVSGAASAGGVA